MKAVKLFAPRDMRVVEIEKPIPLADEALIRVESVGVCGSDMHYYEEGRIGSATLTEPLILGHEYSGIVEAIGANADPALIGRRVAVEPGRPCFQCEWCRRGHYNVCSKMRFPGGPGCDGALAEYACALAQFCFPVPETCSPAVAAMAEPLAVAVHTVELAELRPGDTAAILGLGPIGLLTAQVAKIAGAQTIYGGDPLQYRVEASARYGVDAAFNVGAGDATAAILAATNGRGVDVVFDCARSSATPSAACRIARPAGRVVLTGISGAQEDLLAVEQARRKELTLRWCRRFLSNYPVALKLIASGKVDVASLITHSFPLDRAHEAFEMVSCFRDNALKVSVDSN